MLPYDSLIGGGWPRLSGLWIEAAPSLPRCLRQGGEFDLRSNSNSPPCLCRRRRDKGGAPSRAGLGGRVGPAYPRLIISGWKYESPVVIRGPILVTGR